MDEQKFYLSTNYQEAKEIIREKLKSMSRTFIAAGFYLRLIRDTEGYKEDGYKDIWEFAEDQYGIKRSTTSRWMSMNEKFSDGGNSPFLAEEFSEFGKSQLQEMLYLDDKQIEEATPGMTVKEIRELREAEKVKEDPVSILGYPLRVHPEGSLIATPGCGKQDCFSCHRDGCELRQVDCYCVEAPMGLPFPCTTLNVAENLRQEVGMKCQFVNEDLAYHRVGDGQPVPCCKKCSNPCGYECGRSVKARNEAKEAEEKKMCDVAQNPEADITPEKHSCPPDAKECIRQQWGTSANEQHEGSLECAKCWNKYKERKKILESVGEKSEEQIPGQMNVEDYPELLPEKEEHVIDAEYKEIAAENAEIEELCCENSSNLDELTFSQIAIRDYLEEEEQTLSEYEKVNSEDGGLPHNLMMRQRMLVKALRLLKENEVDLEDTDEPEELEPVQQELPLLKNNDQRKEWLEDYKAWGLWYRDENIDVNYYKYDFSDGSRLVVAECPQREGYWNIEPQDEHYFHLLEKNKKKYARINKVYDEKFRNQTDSETYLVEFLKNLQKGEKR